MALPQFVSTDGDRARIVLVVVCTLSAIALICVTSIVLLVILQRPVANELYTLTGSVVTGLLAMLVKTSSTDGTTSNERDPVPVTVSDEPIQVQEVSSSAQWPEGAPEADPLQTSANSEFPTTDERQKPVPYPQGTWPSER